MLALVFALALAQAGPAPAADAPAQAPASTAANADMPRGKPTPDYDFVAWCRGALTGHMALYTVVKPELTSIERPDEVAVDEKNDHLQMMAGREYLALYTRALDGVDKGHAAPLLARRRAAEAQGAAIWDPFKDAAPRQRMWAYVGWDLPGRCETAARKMLTPSGRLAALRSPAPVSDASGGEPAPSAEPPKDIDDALSTAPTSTAPAGGPTPDPSTAPAPSLRGPQ